MIGTTYRSLIGLFILLASALPLPLVSAKESHSGRQPRTEKPASCRNKLDYPQSFFDRAAGPPGGWSLSYWVEQTSSPVVIVGINGFGGRQPGKEKGLAITCASLRNDSGKVVTGVRLSWVLSTDKGRKDVVLRGAPIPVGVRLAEGEKREVDFEDILFSEASRPLVKGRGLEGAYYWFFRVSEVSYEDGTTWREAAS